MHTCCLRHKNLSPLSLKAWRPFTHLHVHFPSQTHLLLRASMVRMRFCRPKRYPSSRLPSRQGTSCFSTWPSGNAVVLPKSIIHTWALPVWSWMKSRELPMTWRRENDTSHYGAAQLNSAIINRLFNESQPDECGDRTVPAGMKMDGWKKENTDRKWIHFKFPF